MGFGNLALSADKTNLAVREPGPMQPQPTVASNSGLLFNLQSSRKTGNDVFFHLHKYPSPLSVVHSNLSLVLLLATAPFRQIALLSSLTRQGSPSRHTVNSNLLWSRSDFSL